MGKKGLKLALGLALVASLLIVLPAQAENENTIRVLVDGQPLKLASQPAMVDGRVYVQAAGLLAALEANLAETRENGTVKLTASWRGKTIEIRSHTRFAKVDGTSSDIGATPKVFGNSLYVPVRWLGETLGAKVNWYASSRVVSLVFGEAGLPVVGSGEHLQALVKDAMKRNADRMGNIKYMRAGVELAFTTTVADAESAKTTDSAAGDYSQTNVQVAGVDEADLVKTDGTHLYQVSGNRVIITRAVPADDMRIVSELSYDNGFVPREIYAEPGRLIVIGTSVVYENGDTIAQPLADGGINKMIYPPVMPRFYSAAAYVYDTSDIGSPSLVRVMELEGDYLSSRKIGDNLYLISNKWMDVYRIMEEDSPAIPVPQVRDFTVDGDDEAGVKADGDGFAQVPLDRIWYFPDFVEPNYLLIGSVNLAEDAAMDVRAYLGSGQNVYASREHLYTAVTRHEPVNQPAGGNNGTGAALILPRSWETSTDVYKFALLPGKVEYLAKGSVPGTILNQFSMDEFDGHFRIATTTGEVWAEGDRQSKNHLYILDGDMKQVGQVTDIAPGERIYSVRFMGKRAYMVTFRTVDPLFAIDVSDPADPKVLGALKIPGYSDYLHPYDENHLIGFGKDTVEVSWKDGDGHVVGTNAYYLGMKVALFDVTDVTNPIEKHVIYIGDRGTHSDVLYNHKALLFSREKNLLAFPVDLYEVNPKSSQSRKFRPDPEENRIPEYGTFTYQGAYVYSLDPENGFALRGRITHLDEEELLKAGQYWHNGERFVRRILYIGDTLYTLSDTAIKANAMEDLSEAGMLDITGRQ